MYGHFQVLREMKVVGGGDRTDQACKEWDSVYKGLRLCSWETRSFLASRSGMIPTCWGNVKEWPCYKEEDSLRTELLRGHWAVTLSGPPWMLHRPCACKLSFTWPWWVLPWDCWSPFSCRMVHLVLLKSPWISLIVLSTWTNSPVDSHWTRPCCRGMHPGRERAHFLQIHHL